MQPYLYGLDHASHDFREPSSLGKNIFTNAFPLSLGQYLDSERWLPIPLITAAETDDGELKTIHVDTAWEDIIGTSAGSAYFNFEGVYEGYSRYTHTEANKSDAVVIDRETGQHKRPLEIKLVVVPTSQTAHRDRKDQSCEIVVRPSTVEQLAFSIAHSYGADRRYPLQELITNALRHPNDFQWSNEHYMISALPRVLEAAENIIRGGIGVQTPLVLTAIWRSEGQRPILEEKSFDLFAWTDLAFLQLFTDHMKGRYFTSSGNRKKKSPSEVSRPSRALVWLVRSLLEYSVQGSLNFGRIHSEIAYGAQTDKAGSFSGPATLRHLASEEFYNPRIRRTELEKILAPESTQHLLPERRLDAALAIQHLAQQMSRNSDLAE